ncbi:hypothetical protein DID88_002720 [Monilinia fructigena]|uniref:COP9 signalosome complex subunit 4 n=1 Tax=Monilinia fructigena TaxID=38457 RepID=A0A395IND6_9HELO|nr:hypothetical protein DID88_002720 [Monilinia fructigena]
MPKSGKLMATAYEEDEDNLAAAKILAGIVLESSQRKVTNEEKVRCWIRITRNYLEVDDTTLAEQYLNKAKNVIYTVDDHDLNLHFQLSQARIHDARRNFLAAARATRISCAVLAPAGPLRSLALGRLYKDERAAGLDEFGILEKMFLDRLLSPEECCRERLWKHNLRAASRLYSNIRFEALGDILNLDGDKAEETTASMIEQGRLLGRIDQVKRVIWFEGGEATGAKGSGRAEGIVGRELRRWDLTFKDWPKRSRKSLLSCSLFIRILSLQIW